MGRTRVQSGVSEVKQGQNLDFVCFSDLSNDFMTEHGFTSCEYKVVDIIEWLT